MKVVHYYDRFKPLIGGVETHIENIIQIPSIDFEIVTNAIPHHLLKQRYSKNAVIRRFIPYDRTSVPYKNKTKSRISFPYRVMTDIIRNKNKIEYLKNSNFDILHAHGPALSMNLQKIDRWVKKSVLTKKIPFRVIKNSKILTMHGLFSPFTSNPFAEQYEKDLVMSFNKVICVDEFIQNKIISYGHTNTVLLPNAVDTTAYSFHSMKETEKLKVGFVGRVDEQISGIELLIELANNKPPWLELSIVAAGTNKSIQYLKSNIDKKDVRVISNLDSKKIPEFLPTINVLFNPVMTGAITRVTLESMSCGRPVIMIGKEKKGPIMDRKTGYLIENNIQSVLQLLTELKEERENIANVGQNARDIIESEFSNDVLLPRLVKIYHTLI